MSRHASVTITLALLVACSSEPTVVLPPPPPPPPPAPPPPPPAPPVYDVIDLGTLGGSKAVPAALNDNDQVVGLSSTSDGSEKAFLWENGSMRQLNVSDGWSSAEAITNSGLIAGTATIPGSEGLHAFRWNNGVTSILGQVSDVRVVGMTADRVLVGAQDTEHAPSSEVWENGVWRVLVGIGYGGFSVAKAMNNSGQIVGAAPVDEVVGEKVYHPFVWQAGVMRDLGLLDDFPCGDKPEKNCGAAWAVKINSKGDVVGFGSGGVGVPYHALVWPGGGAVRDLGPGQARAVNEAGEIAGEINSSNRSDGFFWRLGSMTLLPSLGGHQTNVVDVNDLSMVVGTDQTVDGHNHVFVWTPQRGTVDLGAGLAEEAHAVAINARGDIIGYTCPRSCTGWEQDSRAILWRVKP